MAAVDARLDLAGRALRADGAVLSAVLNETVVAAANARFLRLRAPSAAGAAEALPSDAVGDHPNPLAAVAATGVSGVSAGVADPAPVLEGLREQLLPAAAAADRQRDRDPAISEQPQQSLRLPGQVRIGGRDPGRIRVGEETSKMRLTLRRRGELP
ncbi:hypothetical protein [Microbacterium lacticum]